MNWVVASSFLLLWAGGASAASPSMSAPHERAPRVYCYVETLFGGAEVETLDLSVCTHVIDSFLIPDASGAVRAANGLPRHKLVERARRHGAAVLVAVGGATVPGSTFTAIATHPDALRRFTEDVKRFVESGRYDGVDLDWEFPSPSERGLQLTVVRALRGRLDKAFATAVPPRKPHLILGVSPGAHLEGYDFEALAREVDGFVQFGYDFRNPALGPWAHSAVLWPDGAQQPVEASVRGVASELIRRGVPREKLIIAFPLYGSDGTPWVSLRERVLTGRAQIHPEFLETELHGVWVTGPDALEAKVQKALAGKEIAGGAAAGIALWQIGHQGRFGELTNAVRRALHVHRVEAPLAP